MEIMDQVHWDVLKLKTRYLNGLLMDGSMKYIEATQEKKTL